MSFLLNPHILTPATITYANGFTATTAVADVGRATFTTVNYSGGAVDEGTKTITLPFSVTYFGISYTQIRVNSNSYMTFGTTIPVSLPNYTWSPSANGPGFGVLAHPSSNTDGNYQFVGSLTSGSTFRLRYEGGYPYSFATVNRIWEVVFTSGSALYQINLINTSARDASGQGQNLVASNGTIASYTVANPASNSSYFFVAQ